MENSWHLIENSQIQYAHCGYSGAFFWLGYVYTV